MLKSLFRFRNGNEHYRRETHSEAINIETASRHPPDTNLWECIIAGLTPVPEKLVVKVNNKIP